MKLNNSIKSNTYLLNVITLMSGTAISQAIMLVGTPFLTRIFTPDEFGVFALYIAIVGIITVVSSWKYELAIMLPQEEKDAQALLFLSTIAVFITALVVFLVILIFRSLIARLTDNIDTFIWILPLGVLASGLLQVFTTWGARKEFFRTVSSSRIVQSTTTIFGQAGLEVSGVNSLGLIWGNFSGTLIAVFMLMIHSVRKNTLHLRQISRQSVLHNMREYQNFPKYQSFSVLINAISQHLPVILLTFFFSPAIAGFFSLTNRALNTPARLIGGSVRPVYYQRASRIFAEKRSIGQILSKSTVNLAAVSIVPYLIVGLFARRIFAVLFGAEWLISGVYAQILMVSIFSLTINPPAVMSLQILGLQKFSLYFECVVAVFRFLSIYLGYQLFQSHYVSIAMFALVGFVSDFYLIGFVFQKVRKLQQISKTG